MLKKYPYTLLSYIKKLRNCILLLLSIPVIYGLISLICSYITVFSSSAAEDQNHTIYLTTNGVHLEIILQKSDMPSNLLKDLRHNSLDSYFSFGWGDKNFYVNTPEWEDLSLSTGFKALFLNTSTLLHVTKYSKKRNHWIAIRVSDDQLRKLNRYINNTFTLNQQHQKILLPNAGYHKNDDFYESNGNYHCFRTCNTWINSGFKKSGIKACLWTPYDFRLLELHSK